MNLSYDSQRNHPIDSSSSESIDVVIVTFASRDRIRGTLDAVIGIPCVNQTIVIEHGNDTSGEIAAALGAIVEYDRSNPGYGAGQNRGLRRASSPYVMLLNPDALVNPDGVQEGLEILRESPTVAAVQGVIINEATGKPERSFGRPLSPLHLWGRSLHLRSLLSHGSVRNIALRSRHLVDHVERIPSTYVETETLSSVALLARRDALVTVNGFDESIFLYGEDQDLCRRLRDAGWGLMALPIPWATHATSSSSESTWEKELHWWQGTMSYAASWFSRPAWIAAIGASVVQATQLIAIHPLQAKIVLSDLVLEPAKRRRLARLLS